MTVRRSRSLRARVAIATALVAALIVAVLGAILFPVIHRANLLQIDQKLTAAVWLIRFNPDHAINGVRMSSANGHRQFAISVYQDGVLTRSTEIELPKRPPGKATVRIDEQRYRMITIRGSKRPNWQVAVGVPTDSMDRTTSEQRRWVLGAGMAAILVAAGLGWLLGGRAVRPIVALTDAVRERPPRTPQGRSGVREADELAEAVTVMLRQVADAQAETTTALATARDFASASAHELRTPLTAMRTDIEVLRTVDLDRAQRAEILDDLDRIQSRVESTLTALERLATGELVSERDYTDTDLADLCDQAAQDAMRLTPGLVVEVDTDPELIIHGLRAGLRMAVDNALANSVRHGGARLIRLVARRTAETVVITVDDNGRGIPESEREAVFTRFHRGTGAAPGGSGLGLALVAQQAQLHHGRARFADSPLGGARLILELETTPTD